MRDLEEAMKNAPRSWAEVDRRALEVANRVQAENYFESPAQVALAEAAQRGDIEGMRWAIEQGANLNQVGRQGITPLLWAMIKQNFKGYEFLLEQGANPNLATEPPNGRGYYSPIELAAAMPDSSYLESALSHGGNPNSTYTEWKLPIIYQAIIHRRLNNVKLLSENGADLNQKDKSGATPLIEAVTARQFKIALFLLQHGADPTLETKSGFSGIDFVQKYGRRGIDRRTNDLAAFDEFVGELKERGLLKKGSPEF